MICFEQKPEYLEWANKILEVNYPSAADRTVWITKVVNGKPSAVVIFTNFTTYNCEMSIATDAKAHWATPGFLATCYRYAFSQMKLARITVVIDESNAKSLRLCEKLGHIKEGLLLNWFGNKNGVAMRMLATECKWIQEKIRG